MTKLLTARVSLLLFLSVAVAAVPLSAQPPAVVRTATPTPTPVASPTPTPVPVPTQTLADLQSRIRSRLFRPELRRGQVGIKIASLNSGKVVFEENSEKYFMPASNMKNFTVAAGIEKLSPTYRYVTSVYAPKPPDSDGDIEGDLRIYGRGDVSMSTSFSEGNYFKGLDDLADKIAAAGVKEIHGDLIADESYFKGGAIPGSWEWDDLQWYYGAEISALPLNDNAVDLSVRPGRPGTSCTVVVSPFNPVYRVVNNCLTGPAGSQRTLRIEKKLAQNILEITGTLPADNDGFKGYVTVTRPAELFIALLKQRLEAKGIKVRGRTRVINTPYVQPTDGKPDEKWPATEIARVESAPFGLIAAKTMKPSQNMYTETILWTLGEEIGRRSPMSTAGNGTPVSLADSEQLGRMVVKNFLMEIGLPEDAIVQHDGSGLSRHNLVTPAAIVHLYTYMAKRSKYSNAWRESLTIGGVDGTLRNRFRGTAASNNIRGKTGTIDQVSALSGYITTAGGEELVFSILVNGVPQPRNRTSLIDDIVLMLANFNGRVDQ